MVLRSAIHAGNAYIALGIQSRIDQGIKGAEKELRAGGRKLVAIGATIATATGGILAYPANLASKAEDVSDKFNTVFGKNADEMRKWAVSTADALGLTGTEVLRMAGDMQDLLVPMGVVPDKAESMTKTLSTLAVDLASFNSMRTSDSFRDLTAAMTGSGEVMKKYGVILTESAVKQELLNMQLDPSTADNAAKAQARLNIILRSTTAAQGDAERTATSYTNAVKRLGNAGHDVIEAFGKPALRDFAIYITTLKDGVLAARDYINENQDIVRVASLVAAGVGVAGVGVSIAGAAMKATSLLLTTAMSGLGVVTGLVSTAFTVFKGVLIATSLAGIFLTSASVPAKISMGLLAASLGLGSVAGAAASTSFGSLAGTLVGFLVPAAAEAGLAALGLGGAWATAGVLAGVAWDIMLGPIGLAVAGLTALAAAGAAVAAVIGWAVVTSINWGDALRYIKGQAKAVAGDVMIMADAFRFALQTKDYEAAYRVFWLSLEVITLDATIVIVDAMSNMWDAAESVAMKAITKITTAHQSMIKKMSMHVFTGGISTIVGVDNAFDSGASVVAKYTRDMQTSAMKARIELKKLRDELNQKAGPEGPAARTREAKRVSHEYEKQVQKLKEQIVEIRLGTEAAMRFRLESEGYTQSQINNLVLMEKQRKLLDDQADSQEEAARKARQQEEDNQRRFTSRKAHLEEEVAAIKQGADAARRMRLEREGFNRAQIRTLELLEQERKEAEKAEKKKQDNENANVEKIFKAAEQLKKNGVDPQEVFERTQEAIRKALEGGFIDLGDAQDARKRAQKNLQQDEVDLQAEGDALARALMTPIELLNAEFARIEFLEKRNNIDPETAKRARAKAEETFEEQSRRANKALNQAQTGTFSAVAASILGRRGPSVEQLQLVQLKQIAKNTKQNQPTRFGK